MDWWRKVFSASIALALLLTAACSRGMPQADYDRLKADLAAAQGQATDLGVQLASAKASLDKATAELAQARAEADKAQTQAKGLETQLNSSTASLDKANADLQKLQGLLNAAQGYTKIADLSLMNGLVGAQLIITLPTRTPSELRAEFAKAVETISDPMLKAFWNQSSGQGVSQDLMFLAFVRQPAALNAILTGEPLPGACPPATTAVTPSPAGQTELQVKVLYPGNLRSPISNVEIGLWRADAQQTTGSIGFFNRPSTPPDSGVAKTDASGVASFAVADGLYYVGLGPANAPGPGGIFIPRLVWVAAGMVTQVEIPVYVS